METNPIDNGKLRSKTVELYQRLARCAVESMGVDALVRVAAQLTGAQIVVQDIKGLILAKSGETHADAGLQVVVNIIYDSQIIGKLYFTAESHQQPNIRQAELEYIANLISLEIYKQKQFSDSAAKRRLEFIHDLLLGENTRDENIVNRSRYLGIELDQTMGLIVIDIDDFVKFAMNRDEQQVAKTKELIYLATTLAVDLKSIVVPRSDKLIVLVPLNENETENDKECTLIANKLRKTIAGKVSDVTTTIGIGSICKNLLDLRRSYLEASEAINIGRITFGTDRVIRYTDLGVFLLLPSLLRDNPYISVLFASWCGKIVDYDRTKGTELFKTLENYLDNNGDINETSARLHIHRNTLRYRLEKLDELTEGRCLKAENKLHYLLLIKMWRLGK